ncbi:unnamed protein product [Mytilus coruscus]|uniref:Uncharacterized protein n=1 Tax=Mytilus coruscus TaxID=42192 RepID=A0A6J8CTU9_MYTCO|nr:unnamed protein product [Mytilus coruscus]
MLRREHLFISIYNFQAKNIYSFQNCDYFYEKISNYIVSAENIREKHHKKTTKWLKNSGDLKRPGSHILRINNKLYDPIRKDDRYRKTPDKVVQQFDGDTGQDNAKLNRLYQLLRRRIYFLLMVLFQDSTLTSTEDYCLTTKHQTYTPIQILWMLKLTPKK